MSETYAHFLNFLCVIFTKLCVAIVCCFQVEKKRQEDAANGVTIAKCLEGFLERKV